MECPRVEINVVVIILVLLDFCSRVLVQMHISVRLFVSAGQKIVFEFLVLSLLDLHVIVTHCVRHLICVTSLHASQVFMWNVYEVVFCLNLLRVVHFSRGIYYFEVSNNANIYNYNSLWFFRLK